MSETQKLLFVDDEPSILSALRRLFHGEGYEIFTSSDPLEALRLLEKQPVELILSDYNMPAMKGSEFLEKASAVVPDAIRILLTAFGDVSIAMDAINRGKVYKFILKPWNDQDLKITVRQALRQYTLAAENRRLNSLICEQNGVLKELNSSLEKKVQERTAEIETKNIELVELNRRLSNNFMNSIRVFAALVDMRSSYVGNHSRRVAEMSAFIAQKMCRNEEEAREIEIAALLHDIGTIGVSDAALKKEARHFTREDRESFRQHPLLGHAVVKSFEGLDRVALIIKHHHEHYDGTGFPEKLQGDGIPLGARIIAVPDRYDALINSREFGEAVPSHQAIVQIGRLAGTHFDPRAARLFLKGLNSGKWTIDNDTEFELPLAKLQAGMVVSRDLRSVSGLLLVPKDSTISAASLEKIKKHQQFDPIISGIYVYRQETAPARNS